MVLFTRTYCFYVLLNKNIRQILSHMLIILTAKSKRLNILSGHSGACDQSSPSICVYVFCV